MFTLVPLIGGVALGRFAPRRMAIAVQVVLTVLAIAMLAVTAPAHGGHAGDLALDAPALVVGAAAALLIGMWLRARALRIGQVSR